MQSWPYRIYAAPKSLDDRYCAGDTRTLFVQGFRTRLARDDFWKTKIAPETSKKRGPEYEYVMCDFPDDGQWLFVSERRYSDCKLIDGNVDKFRAGQSPIPSSDRSKEKAQSP